MLDISIFFAMGLLLTLKSKAKIWFLRVTIAMFFFALFLTGNKGGTWSVIMMTFFFLFISKKLRRNFFRNAIICFCLILVVFAVSAVLKRSKGSKETRLVNVSLEEESSLGQRLLYWGEGFKQLDKRSLTPFGLGIGGYTDVNALKIPQPHNLYLHMLFDFGFIGILLVCTVLVILARMFLNTVNYQETYLQNMSIALAVGLCCVGLTGLVSTTYYSTTAWLTLALGSSTFYLVQKELSEKKSVSSMVSST
jgi:O-antigen ligase